MERLYIVKIGGNIIDDEKKLLAFLSSFSMLKGNKILVHGGGKAATDLSRQMGLTPRMVNGRRITDADTLKVVTMVYAGLINKNIVAQLQASGCNAIGLTGADANIIPAVKRPVKDIDYGFVGDVDPASLAAGTLELFLQNGIVPVVAPVTHDEKGQLLNTNADTIASSLAAAMAGIYNVSLLYCFEKNGVLRNVEDEQSLIPEISLADYEVLRSEGVISKGMIPKLGNAFAAIKQGVDSVYITHADRLHHVVNEEEIPGTRLYEYAS